ncbi:hypothetical protein [Saliphagus sp. LR7]|uniref:hypothetical protein n=1 Tax=Saliphagus sp. LR7 TaxID=2282654 RepID=UPI000DF821BB|nr:hypothetical protein [Saliphagus sp. LR7]
MDGPDAFEVRDVAVIGRTFEEYLAMFDLEARDLEGERVLDCPSGAGSFAAGVADRGVSAVGADRAYRRPPAELARRCRSDTAAVADQLPEKRELFDWEYYGSVEGRIELLKRACETFLGDYRAASGGRYVAGALPDLPFADDAFSLALSAHLLFLYDDRFDRAFHAASLRELARVAREVRVYPLQGLDAEPSGLLDGLIEELRAEGYDAEIRPTPFEFQRGSTDQLVISG